MKYLVIDDSKLARLSLTKSLKAHIEDAEIFQAANGLEALELTKMQKADIAFFDLTMSLMNGYKALPLLLEENPKLKVVVSADIQEPSKILEIL